MQSLKKNLLFILMALFVASFGGASLVWAQSAGMTADVPFDFAVGKVNLKAGSYSVKNQGAFVAFSQFGRETTYSLLYQGGKTAERNGQPYLVFTRYGSESFLKKIVFSADQSYDVPRSKREKEIVARGTRGEEVAMLMGAAR
jgi:hypothetical protein